MIVEPRPLISVVIPVFNGEHFVAAAVDSVRAQTFADYELLVVDDGSTDRTLEVLARYGEALRILRQPNRGVSGARNRGMTEGRGRFIAFLDADDAWLPSKLEKQLQALTDNSVSRICYTAVQIADDQLNPLREQRSSCGAIERDRLLVDGNLVTGSASSVLCERSVFEGTGGFDESLSLCADWDMWVRLSESSPFTYVDDPLVIYRQSANSMSQNPPVLEHDTLALLAKAFSGSSAPSRRIRRRALGRQMRVIAGSYLHARMYRSALRCLLIAVIHDPAQAVYALGMPRRARLRRLEDSSGDRR